MRSYPTEEYELKEIEELSAEDWMVECLKMNPSYVYWGSFEDYMTEDKAQWSSRVIVDTVHEGLWELDELNEIVNFYFEVTRNSVECDHCERTGLNPETKHVSDDWYDFAQTGRKWEDKLTQIEVDALWNAGRLRHDFKERPNSKDVNDWSRHGFGHDAINREICVEARAKSLGVWGSCEHCKGKGYVYTENKAHLALQLWVIHPRKGCSRGLYIKNVEQDELPEVIDYLKAARQRNYDRFSKLG